MLAPQQISESEIALIKCTSSKDYKRWLDSYGTPDNPFINEANEKYDDSFFAEHKTISGYKKYLELFPLGKHAYEAQIEYDRLTLDKKARENKENEVIENIGVAICIILFLGLLLGPVIAKGWSIGESFALACSFTPLYYGIICITKSRKE